MEIEPKPNEQGCLPFTDDHPAAARVQYAPSRERTQKAPISDRAQACHLRHDDELSGLSIHGLDDPRHSAVANGESPHQPSTVHHCQALVADGEEDVGLRLGASLRGDLEWRETAVPSTPLLLAAMPCLQR